MTGPSYLGLDVGISTTDVVAEWAPGRRVSLPTREALETAETAIRRFVEEAPPPRGTAAAVAATGVGARRLDAELCSLPVRHVDEIEAIGRGGVAVARVAEALVVSLGTGTAMVSVRDGEIRHVAPGTGVGGATMIAFARALAGAADLEAFAALAGRGDRSRVDLTVGEVVGGPLGSLPPEATAANLAKWTPATRPEDLAAGLAGVVSDVVLAMAFLGMQVSGRTRAVLIGRLARFEPVARRLADLPAGLRSLFLVPDDGDVATALGAIAAAREAKT